MLSDFFSSGIYMFTIVLGSFVHLCNAFASYDGTCYLEHFHFYLHEFYGERTCYFELGDYYLEL